MGGSHSSESTLVNVEVTKAINTNDFTDDYRCCKEEYRLKTSSAIKVALSTKKLECNDKLVIPPSSSTNRIVKDKLDYYLNDIRATISD